MHRLDLAADEGNLFTNAADNPIGYKDPLGLVVEPVLVPTPNGMQIRYFDTAIVLDLMAALAEAKATGIPIQITSAFRTLQEHADIRAHPRGYPVAQGASYHEAGLAFDFNRQILTATRRRTWLQIAARHGFCEDVADDPIHLQIRHIQEYGYGSLDEAIRHNQRSRLDAYLAQRAGERLSGRK